MASPTVTARSGRDLAKLRITPGLSLTQVAAEMSTNQQSLRRWETGVLPLEPDKLERWEAAHRTLAERRSLLLAQQGWRPRELPSSIRQALRQLQVLPAADAAPSPVSSTPATVTHMTVPK